MKIITIISLCFFFYCLFSERFVVEINDRGTDSPLARICAALLAAIIMFAILTLIFSPLLLIWALAR